MGGGVQVVPPPKPSEAEIRARLIELGKVPLRDPHTVYVVEDPPSTGLWPYHDRSHLDCICYAIPVQHLEIFGWSVPQMEKLHTTFYAYKYRSEAISDATQRLIHTREVMLVR